MFNLKYIYNITSLKIYQNMTWPLAEALRPSVINMVYKKNNETLYTSAGFIGYIGVFTGVKLGIKKKIIRNFLRLKPLSECHFLTNL